MRLATPRIMLCARSARYSMSQQIGMEDLIAMVRGAIQQVRDGEKILTEFDSACGDGDHGISMGRAASRMEECLASTENHDLQSTLYNLGWTVLGVDGGSTGPLLGSFFLGMSESAGGKTHLDATDMVRVFQAGLDAVQKLTTAKMGDKTMMDALIPAVQALKSGATAGNDIPALLYSAAFAAENGAASTKTMIARFGKARFSGQLSLGHQDAGATSMALLFRGFYQGILHLKNG